MAYSVTQQPAAGIYFLRSPIIVTQKETTGSLRNDPTFRYAVEVRVWIGTIAAVPTSATAVLLRPPNPDTLGSFNISPILEDYFEASLPMTTADLQTAGIANVQLKSGYYLNGAFVPQVTGATIEVVDGYAIQQSAINSYSDFTDIRNCDKILTPSSEQLTIGEYGMWAHVYRGFVTDARNIRYGDGKGEEFDVSFSSPNPPIFTISTIYRFPISPTLVAALAVAESVPNWNPTTHIDVQLIDTDGDDVLDSIRVNLVDRYFCDVATDTIAYVNRYGVWDYIEMRGRTTETVSQTRTTYARRIARYETDVLTYPFGASEAGVIGVIGSRRFTMQTGYVPESMGERIQDLLLSKVHYSARLNQNLKLDTSSLEIKQKSQTDLINYSLEFSLAGNLMQSIE